MREPYTDAAASAIVEAVREQSDFGGWLGGVLGQAAAELGSTDALTAGRPGSWEAELVQRLVKGTVGSQDEHLSIYVDHGTVEAQRSDRGECPACGRDVALRNGKMCQHRASVRQVELAEPGELAGELCPASGLTIAETTAKLEAELEALRRMSE